MPQPDLDRCRCPKPKRSSKKRQPRTVCYRGTYVQRSKGISYRRLEEVPCEGVDSLQGVARKLGSSAKRAAKRKASKFITNLF